nr:hypothetical protein BdHM001_23140 [Bdellovibrio sp. HM001]
MSQLNTKSTNRLVVSNGTGSALTTFTCGTGQMLTFDATGMMTCSSFTNGSIFTNGGNSFAANATLGTNDNFNLNFETNSAVRMTVLNNGNVGIGTQTPAYALSVYRGTASTTSNVESGNNGSAVQSRYAGFSAASAAHVWGAGMNLSNGNAGYEVYDYTAGVSRLFINTAGNMGVGTLTPGQKLTVAGTVESTSGGFKFPDGSVQTTAAAATNLGDTNANPAQNCYHLKQNRAGVTDGVYWVKPTTSILLFRFIVI